VNNHTLIVAPNDAVYDPLKKETPREKDSTAGRC
jgi:hypothetical protein